MIQIIALREFTATDGKVKKKHQVVSPKWLAPTVADLFKNAATYVAAIPEAERFNIYYTAANCEVGEGVGLRKLQSQKVIPFDIDNINKDKTPEIVKTVLETLGVDKDKTGVVMTGNGIQLLVEIPTAFTTAKYFEENRVFYKSVCDKINASLRANNLEGTADPSVFSPARILRLPLTENRKPKGITKAEVLQPTILEQEFSLQKLAGFDFSEDYHLSDESLKKYPAPDMDGVLKECEFIKYCKENQDKINEPQWYALLSILGRLPDGELLAHDFSKEHPNYSETDTKTKFEQAVSASGPRTCKNVQSHWGKCQGCKHWGKLTSPILIKGPNYIPTRATGFHNIINGKGGVKIVPNYEDLRKFFEMETQYRTQNPSQIVYGFNGKHFEEVSTATIYNFAQTHFKPLAKENMRSEFNKLVCCTRLEPTEFFSVKKKINLQNGILDFQNMNLLQHTPTLGFRYVLPYAYDPKADCPRFKQFMDEITGGDREISRVLLEFFGYALSGDEYWLHKALIMTGEGANGKSTLLWCLSQLAGIGNYSALSMFDLEKETNRYLLDGKLFNISEETLSKALFETSNFKNFSSGGEVPARQLYKNPYFFFNIAKLIFTCNELPPTLDTSKGLARRLLIVPFKQCFEGEREDKHLKDKLLLELPGIFNLCLGGYKRLLEQQNFTNSKEIEAETRKYVESQDHVGTWATENILVNGDWEKFTAVQKIYGLYKIEMEQSNIRPLNQVDFGRKLSRHVDKFQERIVTKRVDGRPARVLRGVFLDQD